MMKLTTRRRAIISAVSCAALLGAAAATALASPANHTAIVLKDPAGTAIKKTADGSAKAFSMKNTCFGTAGCHGDSNAGGKAVYSYDDIEKHSYHAQLGANEIRGFNPFNIDDADKWRTGAGPQGKNWVQSPGHVGSW
jgi:hypothetical protein